MAKVRIRAEVAIEEADYEKILAFSEQGDKNPELKDLSALLGKVLTFNIKSILSQIAMAEAQEKVHKETQIESNVALIGIDGAPLTAKEDDDDMREN